MTYSSKEELIQILKQEKIWAEKNLGQNFLLNRDIIKKMIEVADVSKDDYVIEIGPGIGILTNELLKKVGILKSIEVDKKIINYLKTKFKQHKNFILEEGTALKALLPEKPYKVIANIPYSITSPLLTHFLQPKTGIRPTIMVLLVQYEVAQKICAKTGDHTTLSITTQNIGKAEIITKISKNNFFPIPKVDSAILKITTHKNPIIEDTKLLKQITSICFHQRRKKIINSLKNYKHANNTNKLSSLDMTYILKQAKIDINSRPEQLTISDWERLILSLKEFTVSN